MSRPGPGRSFTLLAVLCLACAGAGCATTRATEPERDRESHLDSEPPWTGRTVGYGEDFVLTEGESVAFGAHGRVVQWKRAGQPGVVVDLILRRVPPDSVPDVALREGAATAAAECSLLLVKSEAGEPKRATLRVTCSSP